MASSFGNQEKELYSSEVRREGGEDVLYVNYIGAPFVPNIADYPEIMEKTVDLLIENPNVSRIVFVQQKNYNYDFRETSYLLEIARLYVYLLKQERVLSQDKLVTNHRDFFSKRYNEIFSFLFILKKDPLGAYAELKKRIIEAKIMLDNLGDFYKQDQRNYISLLEKIFDIMSQTDLVKDALPHLGTYKRGSRDIYYR